MKKIEIKDLDFDLLEYIESIHLPEEKLNDPVYIEGNHLWQEWMKENLKKYGSVGKIAISDSEFLGYIQYIPKPSQAVVEIKTISTKKGDREELSKKRLLESTLDEFKDEKDYFDGQKARALMVFTLSNDETSQERDFFIENNFEVSPSDENLLFYQLDEDFEVTSDNLEPPLQTENKDKVLIFCNASSPHCVKEMMDALDLIRDINAEVPVKIIVPFDKTEKLNEIFSMPISILVNDELIRFSLLEDEKFMEKLNDTLNFENMNTEENRELLEIKDEVRNNEL